MGTDPSVQMEEVRGGEVGEVKISKKRVEGGSVQKQVVEPRDKSRVKDGDCWGGKGGLG